VFELLVAARFGTPIVSLSPGPFKKGRGISVSRRDLLVISARVTIRQIQAQKQGVIARLRNDKEANTKTVRQRNGRHRTSRPEADAP